MSAAPPRPRGRRRVLVIVLAAALALWLVVALAMVAVGAARARSAMDEVADLGPLASGDLSSLAGSVGGDTDDVEEETLADRLDAARSDVAAAADSLRSPVVRPLWFTPVLGRQLRSAAALATAAETTTGAAADAVGRLDDVLAESTATGPDRVRAVELGAEVLDDFASEVEDLDLGPTEALLPPLADARNRFAEEYARVTAAVEENAVVLTGVAEFLEGPTRYLLLAANNAEMRAGAGMALQVGPLEVSDGSFVVDEFTATEVLVLPEPSGELDPDVAALWGQLSPAREWRNLNLTPRFDATAPLAAEMWGAAGGGAVDGVMSIDVVAVERLLALTGPVTLPSGESIAAEGVLQDLLVDQYAEFDDRDARRERLGQVARAVFEALNERPISAGDLVDTLRDLGAGRHVLMWSSDPLQQDAWTALGVDGTLPADALQLSVLNRGGNKLDPYLGVRSTLQVEDRGELLHVTVTAALRNGAPEGLPPYVAGPHPFTDMAEGEYKGIVALTMPGGAGNVEIAGGVPAALGEDGPTRVAATEVRLLRGEEETVTVSFDLPRSWESVQVLASARVVPTEWHHGDRVWTDDLPREVPLDGTE